MQTEVPAAASAAAPRVGTGIRFEDVTVAYKGTVVLDSLNLEVEPGEVMALLGPSGSGKTTALRSVAGFVRPVRGRVLIGDRDITNDPPYKRGIGMVVQQYALFPHMRVADNVAFGLKANRTQKSVIKGRVEEALAMVGMEKYAKRYPRELSGGQQQRVAIARALAIRPKVLLLDEPLSALDAQLRSGMLAELNRLHRELPDVTILYVTHDQVEALTLADRIAVMNNAKLDDCGTAEELYTRPRTPFTAGFLGNANLLPVTVESYGDGRATVSLGGNSLLVHAHQEVIEGTQATLCVQPHGLSLTAEPGCENQLSGTVTEVQWRGTTHRIYLEVAGQQVKVDTTALRNPPAIGVTLGLHFGPSDAVLVGADG